MAKKGKLELTWVGKDERIKLEPRVLVEDSSKSYGDPDSENMLIYGDNLLALKALEQDSAGKIKCIYIDPPFNTGSAFEEYDDNLEHSIWLTMMRERLFLLKELLTNNGSIYVHIDNNEQAYLKIVMDEIFGRNNFVQTISVKRASPAGFKVINPGPLTVTDYILLYAKDKEYFDYKPVRIPVSYDENYDLYITNPEADPEQWLLLKLVDLLYERYSFKGWKDAKTAWGSNWKIVRNSLLGDIAIELKDRVVSVRDPHKPSDIIVEMMEKSKENRNKVIVLSREKYDPIYFYNGGALSFYKEKLRVVDGELTPTELLTDFWSDIKFAGIAKEGNVQFKNNKKPEMLIKRVLELSTEKGEWILDSFLGSGTTAAVAHKMGRKWIGIELGEHCDTHCLPRLKRVVSGEDQTGISKTVNWQGGGGFKYYKLAESLLVRDKDLSTKNHPVYIINPRYDEKMLIRSICKIENFRYRNNGRLHGISSESRFLHITTNLLTQIYLDSLAEDIGKDQSLLIYCTRRKRGLSIPDNIEIKKIPRDLLNKCDFEEDKK